MGGTAPPRTPVSARMSGAPCTGTAVDSRAVGFASGTDCVRLDSEFFLGGGPKIINSAKAKTCAAR